MPTVNNMKLVMFQIASLQMMPRPADYIDRLRAAAYAVTPTTMTFDIHSPAYQALKAWGRSLPKLPPIGQKLKPGRGGIIVTDDKPLDPLDSTDPRNFSPGCSSCGGTVIVPNL